MTKTRQSLPFVQATECGRQEFLFAVASASLSAQLFANIDSLHLKLNLEVSKASLLWPLH